MGNYEADVSVLTGQFLNYLNVCGQKLGYPFMLYSNGECGKKLVSSDGKHNAVAALMIVLYCLPVLFLKIKQMECKIVKRS